MTSQALRLAADMDQPWVRGDKYRVCGEILVLVEKSVLYENIIESDVICNVPLRVTNSYHYAIRTMFRNMNRMTLCLSLSRQSIL
jgi:hypothetical protein